MRKANSISRFLVAAVLLGGILGCATTQDDMYFRQTKTSANVYVSPGHGRIKKVAIMPFRAETELIGASISDLFVTEMLRARRYSLVERSQLARVLNESELALAGLSAADAAAVGSMMGADGVIIGTVDQYGTVAYRGHAYPVIGLTVRLIDSKTGSVVWSVDHAKRARNKMTTLSQHARDVVHQATAALYKRW
jgi:curli biogenesis system outer membrane secretion channel CsgG